MNDQDRAALDYLYDVAERIATRPDFYDRITLRAEDEYYWYDACGEIEIPPLTTDEALTFMAFLITWYEDAIRSRPCT